MGDGAAEGKGEGEEGRAPALGAGADGADGEEKKLVCFAGGVRFQHKMGASPVLGVCLHTSPRGNVCVGHSLFAGSAGVCWGSWLLLTFLKG